MAANTDDPFRNASSPIEGPCEDGFAVTPSDSVNFTIAAKCLYVGGAGTVTIVTRLGTVLQFTVPAGGILPWRCTRVNSTGTTATLIVGGY